MESYHGTTIVSVRRGKLVALGGDGQVTLGNLVIKATARKVRRLHHDQVIAGFAGATADAFTLFERFEAKLEKYQGNLVRSATASIASSRRRTRSVRQSLVSSMAERTRLPWYYSSLASKRSNSVNASAVAPAKPAMTWSW